jgi:hypothetical protein
MEGDGQPEKLSEMLELRAKLLALLLQKRNGRTVEIGVSRKKFIR